MATIIPNIVKWSVVPEKGTTTFYDDMNTWLSETNTVINSWNTALNATNTANQKFNEIYEQIRNADPQSGYSQAYIDEKYTKTLDTLADLRALNILYGSVWLSGYHAKDDGAFGSHKFRLKGVKTTEVDNSGTIIIVTVNSIDYVYELQYDGAVSVKWFGAVGDGGTDDTDAIQNTFDSVANDIYFPEGVYSISTKVVQDRSFVRLRGAGKYKTIIRPLNTFDRENFDCLVEVGNSSTNSHIIEDMSFLATYASDGNDLSGLAINASYNVDILDCKFQSGNYINRANGGLLIRSGKHTRIQNCHFHNGFCYGVIINSHSNGLHFINCAFDECSVNMISSGNILEMSVLGCEFGQATYNSVHPTPLEKRQIDLSSGNHGRIIIDNNTISGGTNTEYGLICNSVEQILIGSNMFSGCTRFAIVHNGSKDCSITGNMFVQNGTDTSTANPLLGVRDYETTTFCTDIFKYSAYLQPFTMTGNTSTITDRPMAWLEGTGTSLSNSQSTIIGNSCSGGSAYIHSTLINDSYPLIDGKRYNSTTKPVEITIPTKTYAGGQVHYGNLSLVGIEIGDAICMSPKTSGDLTPGLSYFATVNATDQLRWTMVNATNTTIVEPDRTFIVSLIKA